MRGFFRCDRRVTTQKHETQFRTAPVASPLVAYPIGSYSTCEKNTGVFCRKLRIFIEKTPVFRPNFPISSAGVQYTQATQERTPLEIPCRRRNTEVDIKHFGKEDK